MFAVRGNPPKTESRSATLKFRFTHRIKGGGFNYVALAGVGARAMEQAVVLFARDQVTQLPPANQSLKYVPAFGLHRTPLAGRRLLLALCGGIG